MSLTHFEKHLKRLYNTVYVEPRFAWGEKLTDMAFERFVKDGMFSNALDVGVGTGYALSKFRQKGINATGISMNHEEAKACNSKVMDMAFLDFEDETFDLVWCRQTLEHSPMPAIALLEFNRVLKSKGRLYVEVPSDSSVHVCNRNHYSVLSDGMWQSLFRKTGFALTFVSQVHSLMKMPDDDVTDIYWTYWLRKDE